jgi:hypothetical protein
MEKFSQYLLDNPRQAILIALILSTLPLLSLFALVLLAFVTLRQGWKRGLGIVVATVIPSLLIIFLGQIDILSVVILNSIPVLVWIFASELRRTLSWAWLIQLGTVLGVLLICALHSVYPDLILWWQDYMHGYLVQAQQLWPAMPVDKMNNFIDRMAKIATGTQIAMVLTMALSCVVMGRYWQAILFNPGQLKPELHFVRLSKGFVWILIILGLLASVGRIEVLIDALPVIALAVSLAGLSLLHYIVAVKKIGIIWLGLFYIVGSILMFYSLTFLCLLGLIDSFFDIRNRIVTK